MFHIIQCFTSLHISQRFYDRGVIINNFYTLLFLSIIPIFYHVLLYILGDLYDKASYYVTGHIYIEYDKTSSKYLEITFRNEMLHVKYAIDIIAQKHDKCLLTWFISMYQIYRDIKWLVFTLQEKKNLLNNMR